MTMLLTKGSWTYVTAPKISPSTINEKLGIFFGIQIQKLDDGSIMLTQPQLIDSIIHDLHLQSGSNPKTTPTVTSKLLHKDTNGPDMAPNFHYDRNPSTNPGEEPPRDARDSGSARSHSTHLETSSSDRP